MRGILRFVLPALLCLVLTNSALAQLVIGGHLSFTPTSDLTGIGPYAVAVGDFNGDGTDDIAVANDVAGTVSILIGYGNGSFKPHVDYPTEPGADSLTVADVNGDGNLDLVVTNGGAPSTVSVLLGNGDGTFQTHVDYTVGNYAYSPVVGDFNNDGKLDIVVTNFSDSTFSLLLGNGDGTFQTPQTIPALHQTLSIAGADFNNDGNLDIAGTDSDNNLVTVYMGNGSGGFSGTDYKGGSQPVSLAIGDFNGDKIADLAVANVCSDIDPECILGGPGTTSIFLGNGDGTFQAKKDFITSYDSLSIAVDDFNGDGRLDVVVANGCNECDSAGNVTVQLGNGDGTLQPARSYTVGNLPDGVATGHFDGSGNGSADIVVANLNSYVGDNVNVLLNDAGTRMKLTSWPNPQREGGTVYLTVKVTAAVRGIGTPSGSVTFYDGKNAIASGGLTDGILKMAVPSLPAGNNQIRAQYAGDENFNRNLSQPLVQVVRP
jgi:Bacterial Ig-like domain (group 3)/FG-GAP-like repeat/FG-GAP repeat